MSVDPALAFMHSLTVFVSKFQIRPALCDKMMRECGILDCVKWAWFKNLTADNVYDLGAYSSIFLKAIAVRGNRQVIRFISTQCQSLLPHQSGETRTFLIMMLLEHKHEQLAHDIFTNLNNEWWPNDPPLSLREATACWKAAIQMGSFAFEAYLLTHLQSMPGCAREAALLNFRLESALESKSPNVAAIFEHFWNCTNNVQVKKNIVTAGRPRWNLLITRNKAKREALIDLFDRLAAKLN
jgi:hypothetical protein